MHFRYYLDPDTGQPHVYGHGVSEDEVDLCSGIRVKTSWVATTLAKPWGKHRLGDTFASSTFLIPNRIASLS